MNFVEYDGIRIPYVVQGDGERPIVFAHGLQGTGAWQRRQLVPLVDAGWTLITFDQRGHAGATPITDPCRYDPRAMGSDLWAVADAAGVDRCWIGGGSMGAATSWSAASAHPERVVGLVQAMPALRDEPHPAIFLFDVLADQVRDAGVEGLIEALMRLVDAGGEAVTVEFLEELRSHEAESLEIALRTVPRWILDDVPSGLAGLPFPVVVTGWDGDPIHPLQTAKDVARAAGVDLIEVDQSAVFDDPTAFGRSLLSALGS